DTQRDYMVTRKEDRLNGGQQSFALGTYVVLASEQHAGLWIPQKMVHQEATGNPAHTTIHQEFVYDAHDFRLNQLSPADLQISFPLESTVVDSIRKIKYII